MISPSNLFSFGNFILFVYGLLLFVLMLYGIHRYWILFLYFRHYKNRIPETAPALPAFDADLAPVVTVQLPLYNEMYVAERLIDAVAALDYPKEKLEIQVLDDSTDDTGRLVQAKVEALSKEGFCIHHVRRTSRDGFKAGALGFGLKTAKGTFVAIFDADFIPPKEFLKATMPAFSDPKVGMVQTRWGHINADYSLLTRMQSIFLDGHFMLEHTARHTSGAFFNFNGTAGIWRRQAIFDAGGWSAKTLTEDLDLSYRAQLAGWRFVYLPMFVCPAELPVDIHSFYSQQKRWTKGAIQVARSVLPRLWRASLPFHTKVEATVHLTANIGYLLTVLVSVLLLPSLLVRHQYHWIGINIMEISAFVSTTVSIFIFYAVSQREIYPDWKWRMRDIPFLMSFGIGMCLHNAMAVMEGLLGRESEFVRTPKYNIQKNEDSWSVKSYAKMKGGRGLPHVAFAVYSLVTFGVAILTRNWMAVPFVLLFAFGFSHLATLSFVHNVARR